MGMINAISFLSLFCTQVYLSDATVLTSVVQTIAGPVRGEVVSFDGRTVHRYRGIPYAAPPLGKLRFAPPEVPDPWAIPINVTEYGNRCMTYTFLDAYFYVPYKVPRPMSEDCLYLNVVVPMGGEPLKAVMVYIHGGTLLYRSAQDKDLEALSIAGDVIHISMNYRLNIFGFLATMDNSAPGNVGLLDQVLALKWVKENIGGFGGDPDRVTIFGISAGGWSVSAHMVSPLSKGLFSRAIIQSGSLYGLRMESREERAVYFLELADRLNCTGRAEDILLDCVRHKSAADVFRYGDPGVMILPTTGDGFLPENVTQMYDSHQVHPDVQVLAGMVSEEGANMAFRFYQDQYNENLIKDGISCYHHLLTTSLKSNCLSLIDIPDLKLLSYAQVELLKNRIRNEYVTDCSDPINALRGALNIMADAVFTTPTIGTVKRITEAGNKAFLYYFNQVPAVRMPTNIAQMSSVAPPALEYGTNHGLDMFYMFGYGLVRDVPMSVYHLLPENEKILSKSMVHSWTTFAKSGNAEFIAENGNALSWPEYNGIEELYIEWRSPMTNSSVKQHLKPAAFPFWRRFVPNMIRDLKHKANNSYNYAETVKNAQMLIFLTVLAAMVLMA